MQLSSELKKIEAAEAKQRKKDELLAKLGGDEATLKAMQSKMAKDAADKEAARAAKAKKVSGAKHAAPAAVTSATSRGEDMSITKAELSAKLVRPSSI